MIKKLLPILLCLVVLAGCVEQQIYQVESQGYSLSVNTEESTITHGTDVYSYARDNSHPLETIVTIRYPNGATYQKTFTYDIVISAGNGSQVSSGSSDASESTEDDGTYTGKVDENRYVPGLVLAKAVNSAYSQERQQEKEKAENAKYLFIAIFLLVAGFINLRFAEGLWWLKHWWSVDGGEPSQRYLDSTRFGGVVFLVLGGIFLLMGIF